MLFVWPERVVVHVSVSSVNQHAGTGWFTVFVDPQLHDLHTERERLEMRGVLHLFALDNNLALLSFQSNDGVRCADERAAAALPNRSALCATLLGVMKDQHVHFGALL